jgi:hypothetical protein
MSNTLYNRNKTQSCTSLLGGKNLETTRTVQFEGVIVSQSTRKYKLHLSPTKVRMEGKCRQLWLLDETLDLGNERHTGALVAEIIV